MVGDTGGTPLILLFVLLGAFRVKAHIAAVAPLALSMVTAALVWRMPVLQTVMSVLGLAFVMNTLGWSLGLLVLFMGLVYLQSTPILGWMAP